MQIHLDYVQIVINSLIMQIMLIIPFERFREHTFQKKYVFTYSKKFSELKYTFYIKFL